MESLPEQFSKYFTDKIGNLRESITPAPNSTPHTPVETHSKDELSNFTPVTIEEITKLVLDSPAKHCDLDPIPTSLLKKCIHILAPVLTLIVNLSLSTGKFPRAFKRAVITPLLKKPTLDKELLSNCLA